jgi:hypothetical protein
MVATCFHRKQEGYQGCYTDQGSVHLPSHRCLNYSAASHGFPRVACPLRNCLAAGLRCFKATGPSVQWNVSFVTHAVRVFGECLRGGERCFTRADKDEMELAQGEITRNVVI